MSLCDPLVFCKSCSSLQKIVEVDSHIAYRCDRCNKLDPINVSSSNAWISKNNYSTRTQCYKELVVSPYTKHDPSLPRSTAIPCMNTQCTQRNSVPKTVVICYDSENMKYVYVCEWCDSVWHSPKYGIVQEL